MKAKYFEIARELHQFVVPRSYLKNVATGVTACKICPVGQYSATTGVLTIEPILMSFFFVNEWDKWVLCL